MPILEGMTDTHSDLLANPLLTVWQTPFGLPPFAAIKSEHYLPALREGIKQAQAEIDAIANNTDAPTFENTIIAMETAGALLSRIHNLFGALTGADTNEALQKTETEIAPQLAEHGNSVMLNAALFARIDSVYEARAKLPPQAQRLVEKYHRDFVESGAKLGENAKKRVGAINIKLSELTTQFSQNKLAEQNDYMLVLKDEKDFEGLPESVIAAAAATAAEHDLQGQHIITLNGSNRSAFMMHSPRRELREDLWKALNDRGDRDNAHDNKIIVLEIVKLRRALAREMGYVSFNDYVLADRMAKKPANVQTLLNEVWTHARPAALAEKIELEDLARDLGHNAEIKPWDWAYYANILRKKLVDFDAEEAKQYLTLDQVLKGVFATATNLFGITFKEVSGLSLYHSDVRAWEVLNADGTHRALFLGDFYARPSKRGGAWMSELRGYNPLAPDEQKTPIIYNVCNFNKPATGDACLLSLRDAETVFHEFGHALHGMLTKADYPSLAGTNVKWDFVELPSQLFEHWLMTDEVLGTYAKHYKSGEPMPQILREKIRQSKRFKQGNFAAGFVASIQLDLAWHALTDDADVDDLRAFERDLYQRLEVPETAQPFYRSTSFGHLFDNPTGYASGYYSYLWAQVLDADAFEAFKETGNVFDPATAQKLHDYVYSAGDSEDPAELYRKFRGRDAGTEPLLRNFGFLNDNSQTHSSAKVAT